MNTGVHFSSKTDLWSTPQSLFDSLNSVYRFTLDPAASKENAKCSRFYTQEENGLKQSWESERVFLNPPYGREIGKWVQKAAVGGASVVVALLPARTDTRWWHDYIQGKAEVHFIKGRLKFGNQKNSAPFPSCVVVFAKIFYEAP